MVTRRSLLMSAPGFVIGVTGAAAAEAEGQLQTSSLLGRELYSLPDNGSIKTAKKKLKHSKKSASLAVKLSQAQASRRQYKEAIETCTEALAFSPQSAELYTERGHRKLGLRDFASALQDLGRAVQLNPKLLDAYYHRGLSYYFLRDYPKAADSFGSALDLAQSSDSLIDCANWRYVALRRSDEKTLAIEVLKRITPDIKNTEPHLFFYLQLLHFYQGKLGEKEIVPPKPDSATDTEGELSFNTISYGVGNWHFYNGEKTAASKYFEQVVTGAAWNSWGFIGSELELAHR